MITYNNENIPFPKIRRRDTTAWIRRVAASYGKTVGEVGYLFCNDEKILEVVVSSDNGQEEAGRIAAATIRQAVKVISRMSSVTKRTSFPYQCDRIFIKCSKVQLSKQKTPLFHATYGSTSTLSIEHKLFAILHCSLGRRNCSFPPEGVTDSEPFTSTTDVPLFSVFTLNSVPYTLIFPSVTCTMNCRLLSLATIK